MSPIFTPPNPPSVDWINVPNARNYTLYNGITPGTNPFPNFMANFFNAGTPFALTNSTWLFSVTLQLSMPSAQPPAANTNAILNTLSFGTFSCGVTHSIVSGPTINPYMNYTSPDPILIIDESGTFSPTISTLVADNNFAGNLGSNFMIAASPHNLDGNINKITIIETEAISGSWLPGTSAGWSIGFIVWAYKP